jgi:hypothetical protein
VPDQCSRVTPRLDADVNGPAQERSDDGLIGLKGKPRRGEILCQLRDAALAAQVGEERGFQICRCYAKGLCYTLEYSIARLRGHCGRPKDEPPRISRRDAGARPIPTERIEDVSGHAQLESWSWDRKWFTQSFFELAALSTDKACMFVQQRAQPWLIALRKVVGNQAFALYTGAKQ